MFWYSWMERSSEGCSWQQGWRLEPWVSQRAPFRGLACLGSMRGSDMSKNGSKGMTSGDVKTVDLSSILHNIGSIHEVASLYEKLRSQLSSLPIHDSNPQPIWSEDSVPPAHSPTVLKCKIICSTGRQTAKEEKKNASKRRSHIHSLSRSLRCDSKLHR
jgi:hypothetical protein